MRNPLFFFVELFKQPAWVTVWVFFLMGINLASAIFWDEPAGRLVFITFLVSAFLMLSLYSIFGYEKILGLGHLLWIPLLGYLVLQLPIAQGAFKIYLITLSFSIGVSLIFDFIDVWKYFSAPQKT